MYQNAVSTNAHPVFLNTPLGTFEVGQKITSLFRGSHVTEKMPERGQKNFKIFSSLKKSPSKCLQMQYD
jgi:hypothetical protein